MLQVCCNLLRTRRSHTGKTKDGDKFDKFLGVKAYDEKLLDFEKFFHTSFCKYLCCNFTSRKLTLLIAKEDCAAHRIIKNKVAANAEEEGEESLVDEDESGQPKTKECSKEGLLDGEDEKGKDLDDDNKGEEESEDSDSEGRKNVSTAFFGGELCAQRRERNIAENKKLLEELNVKGLVKALKDDNKRCVTVIR